jgi:DNA-binding NarL/FixJ family response regulator
MLEITQGILGRHLAGGRTVFQSPGTMNHMHKWMANMIRVLVADDHYLVRQGIRALLEIAEGIEVVGEAENGQEAIALVKSLKPDVVVMDISMPELDGIQATEQIAALDVPTHIVILSMYASTNLVRQALQKGADGYVLKRSASEELLQAVRVVEQGETYLSTALNDSLASNGLN